MSEFTIDEGSTMPEMFEIPLGCEKCPEQCAIGAVYNQLQVTKLLGTYSATSMVDHADEVVDSIKAVLDCDESAANELATLHRSEILRDLDSADDSLVGLQRKSDSLARSCDEPLRMKASKNGKEYTVAVCTSAVNYFVNSDKPKHG